jgi:pimeloyl-ACP methyl ester carboxylesterase
MMSSMQVIVDGLMTNYLETGTGKTILALHGWGSDSSTFAELMKEFGESYLFIAVDLPGFGASQKPTAAWGLDDYAKFVQAFLRKLDSEPFAILAHSNGAAIAVKAVASGVLKPEKLILMGAAGIRPKQTSRKLVLKAIAKTGKAATIVLPPTVRKKIRERFYDKIGSDYRRIEGMEATFNKTVNEDVLPLAAQVDIPTLLLYGEADTSTPPLYGELYKEAMPNATLEVIGGAGHYVHIDAKDKTEKAIGEFLK